MRKDENITAPPPFVILPSDVLADRRLSASEKLLFAHISNLANNNGRFCWATNKYLAGLMDLTGGRIAHMVSDLESCGFVKVVMIYKKDPRGRPTKEIYARRIYPSHYLWNKENLPDCGDLFGAPAPDDNPVATAENGGNTPIAKNSNIPVLKIAGADAKNSKVIRKQILEKKDSDSQNDKTARAEKIRLSKEAAGPSKNLSQMAKVAKAKELLADMESGNASKWLVVEPGMTIDFNDPEFAEYKHLSVQAGQLCKWLNKTQCGAKYTKKALRALMVKFYHLSNRMEYAQDEAFALEPTRQEWNEWIEILRAGRGMRQMTMQEVQRTLAGFVIPGKHRGRVMADIVVKIGGIDTKKWLDDVAQSQIPFAASLALNRTATQAGKALANEAAGKWNIRSAWSKRYQMGRRDAENNPPKNAAFTSTFTDKRIALRNMRVVVATPSWIVAQQTEKGAQTRTIEQVRAKGNGRAVEWLAIPVAARFGRGGHLMPNAQALLGNPEKYKAFVIESNGRRFLCRRQGPGAPLEVLYKLVKSYGVGPRFSFENIAIAIVNAEFEPNFDHAMRYAISTYKPPELR